MDTPTKHINEIVLEACDLPPHNPQTEERVHGASINGISYVITKDRRAKDDKRFVLYQYLPAPTLNDRSGLKPLFEHESFGEVCYVMFSRGFGL